MANLRRALRNWSDALGAVVVLCFLNMIYTFTVPLSTKDQRSKIPWVKDPIRGEQEYSTICSVLRKAVVAFLLY